MSGDTCDANGIRKTFNCKLINSDYGKPTARSSALALRALSISEKIEDAILQDLTQYCSVRANGLNAAGVRIG
jgi:hypothetical protein